jgi:hypothetical protein
MMVNHASPFDRGGTRITKIVLANIHTVFCMFVAGIFAKTGSGPEKPCYTELSLKVEKEDVSSVFARLAVALGAPEPATASCG